jgi:hypothetical protein
MKANDEKFTQIYKPRRQIFLDNLVGGIAWGVGSVIGATLIIGILGIIISQTRSIPFLGQIVNLTMSEIQKQQSSGIFSKKAE